jgi:hypothetical protein
VAAKKPPAKKTAGKSSGGIKAALTRKVGPLPVWAWAGIGGVALYLYRRRAGAGASASTTPDTSALSAPASGGGGDSGVGGGTGGGSGDSGGGSGSSTGTPADVTQPGVFAFPTGVGVGTAPVLGTRTAATLGAADFTKPTAAGATNFGAEALAKSNAASAAGAAQRFGGVTSVSTLKSGAQLTTYATGREVEQVAGKSAFVVNSGGKTASKAAASKPAPVKTPPRTVAPKATKKKPA